jgi:uncharacterized membrane protein YdjX (TVP38/TMEM64 family)
MKLALRVKWLLAILTVLLLAVVASRIPLRSSVRSLLQSISGLGPLAPVLFIAAYVCATIAILPTWILSVGAGVVFGVVYGSIYVSIGATLGAVSAFAIARYVARNRMVRRMAHKEWFQSIDRAVGREGWKIVGLARLSPVFPFTLLNYAFGVSRVSLRDFTLATWIGMTPAIVLYVYIGSLAGDLAAVGETRSRTLAEWILYGSGLLATVAVTIYVGKIARAALRERLQD